MKYNIIWFRNDLRTLDNPALTAALNSQPSKPTRGLFIITEEQWQAHSWGKNKIGFVLQTVNSLVASLAKLNIEIDVICCKDFKELPVLLINYLNSMQTLGLYYNCEYELNESLRDQAVDKICAVNKIQVQKFHSQSLIAPGKILTQQQKPYTVYTPFKRACYMYLYSNHIAPPQKLKAQQPDALPGNASKILNNYAHYTQNPILTAWTAGQDAALKILRNFCEDAVKHYQERRDFPAQPGTSKLSAHLAVGAISVQQCFLVALDMNQQQLDGGNANITCWINELLWRDFYKQIIYHFPNLCKGKNFNTKYDNMRWQKPGKDLELWQNGQTGIPIIDAAMRQLVTTGWMHNRLRMIVAMFLTKNLLIDWRHGEEFFSQHLIDLDFASNNGGWQWSASTGTDSVPYFRIFNPITQSAKFDPEGNFIRQFCPELNGLTSKQIHDPSTTLSPAEFARLNYPRVMVDISKSRLRALEYFKNV